MKTLILTSAIGLTCGVIMMVISAIQRDFTEAVGWANVCTLNIGNLIDNL